VLRQFSLVGLAGLLALGTLEAERVDNVLAQMVPDASTTLVGMRMAQLKATPLFQKMVAQKKLPQLDEFARETGFDPRRDVRDLLLASSGNAAVLLARGNFHVGKIGPLKRTNYHGFEVWSSGQAGYCILDRTLAAAGPLPVLHASLDQYKSRKPGNAAALLGRARAIPENYQLWVVTSGSGNYVAEKMPKPGGADVGRILQSLGSVLIEADLRSGLNAQAEGWCGSAQDAKSLADAVRGIVGMGRLNTPENQPDLLRLWDGIKAAQQDRKVTITAVIGQDLIDQLLKQIESSGEHKAEAVRQKK
jgi:hypothetical protein